VLVTDDEDDGVLPDLIASPEYDDKEPDTFEQLHDTDVIEASDDMDEIYQQMADNYDQNQTAENQPLHIYIRTEHTTTAANDEHSAEFTVDNSTKLNNCMIANVQRLDSMHRTLDSMKRPTFTPLTLAVNVYTFIVES